MRKFIRHPSDIPIEILAEDMVGKATHELKNVSFGGLCCKSDMFLEPGTAIKLKIPCVRPTFETQGKVVWCKKQNGHFDVGIQFMEASDAFAVRMVEQVCHIEQYKNEIRVREGRILSGNEAALEWISKYASEFPNPEAEAVG